MKYCQHCGNALSEGTKFCESCGARVDSSVIDAQVTNETVVNNVNKNGISKRNIVIAIVLSLITCGLYGLYWQVKLNNELLQLSGREGPGGVAVIFLTIITCGIYGYFWYYKMGKCVDDIENKRDGSTSVLFVILALFGIGIVNYIIAQNAINGKVN